MKTLTFTYTKKDGAVSSRMLVAMNTPNSTYAGVDISDLDPSEAGLFAKLAQEAHEAYLLKLKQLQEQFDLKHNYRQFLPSGMSNIEEI